MVHCLWNETSQTDWVRDAVLTAVGESVRGYVLNLSGIETDLQALKKELDSAGALRERADAGLQLVDTYYYQVERVRLAGRLLLLHPTTSSWTTSANSSICIKTNTRPIAMY